MAEIKSTLELVLERTRHLTLSKEEKERQELESIKKLGNGWIQKFIDRRMSLEEISIQWEKLQKTNALATASWMAALLLDCIQPSSAPDEIFTLLRNLCGVDAGPIHGFLAGCRQQIEKMAQERIQSIKKALAEQHDISGDAFFPNLDKDLEWTALRNQMDERFHKDLAIEKQKILLAVSIKEK